MPLMQCLLPAFGNGDNSRFESLPPLKGAGVHSINSFVIKVFPFSDQMKLTAYFYVEVGDSYVPIQTGYIH